MYKFRELTCCPFCGCDEFYTTQYVYGVIRYSIHFDGTESDNEQMYDSLNTKEYTGKAYCRKCERYIGNIKNDTLSKLAEKVLSKR